MKIKDNKKFENIKYNEVNAYSGVATAVLSVVELKDIEEYIAEGKKQNRIWKDVVTT